MKKIFFFLSIIVNCSLSIANCRAATEIRDTEIESKIYEIVRPLAEAADIPANRMKIHIVGDNAFNAYVSGGTEIFINTGLLAKIDSPAELQAVLAHEIGHTVLGHMAQMGAKIRAEGTRALAMRALGIGLMAVNPQAAIGVMAGASGLAAQSMLAFTRDEERAADDYAVKLLAKVRTDPSALLSVFQKMQNSTNQDKINPNNTNHPLPEERIKNIKYRARGAKYKAQEDSHDLKLIQAKLAGYIDSFGRVQTLYPAHDKSNAAIYARAIANIRGGNLELAKTGTLTLISRNKNNPYFYELLGDIEFQFGHYDDSVEAYEKSLSLKKDSPQIEIALALVLAGRKKTGDIERAIKLCKQTLLIEPMPLAYWVLAKTDEKKTDYYLAEYYYLHGDPKQAKSHAKKAIKILPSDSPEYMKANDILDLK
ncbi:MAG: M48 family metalloprotease [Rickettsiales bacterium]|jgi:predicted Zn-dependent protease|nr:M48 family metalloprotease [Rickettsiales bacterium]